MDACTSPFFSPFYPTKTLEGGHSSSLLPSFVLVSSLPQTRRLADQSINQSMSQEDDGVRWLLREYLLYSYVPVLVLYGDTGWRLPVRTSTCTGGTSYIVEYMTSVRTVLVRTGTRTAWQYTEFLGIAEKQEKVLIPLYVLKLSSDSALLIVNTVDTTIIAILDRLLLCILLQVQVQYRLPY